jgi:hypothetical protein
MESALTNIGTMVEMELSVGEMELLKNIARDGQTNFVGLKKEGLQIGQEYYTEIFCQITSMEKYSYKWEGGTNKVVDRNMSREEAKAAGYAEGMDLSLKILKPEFEEEFTLPMPQSSYWNFSKYVQFLLSKNVHPKAVVTKIRTTLKQFKVGSPVAVATFEAVGMIQPEQEAALNVIPKEVEPAPQPVKAPVESSQKAEIPQEWA